MEISFTHDLAPIKPKFAPVQNLPGYVVFYTDFLLEQGIKVDESYTFTALPIAIAKKMNLL